MSQENVKLVAGGFVARIEGRYDDWVETCDLDVEWDLSAYPLPDWPERGSGSDSFIQHLTDYFAGWHNYEATVTDVIDAGDNVVVILHERARMRGSDATLERDLPEVLVWQEALEAAGLEA